MISSVSSNSTSSLTSLLQQQVREKANKPPSATEMFSKMDTDGDGSVTESELTTAMEEMKKNEGSRPPPPDGGQPPSAEEMFAKIDSDSDGKISLTELQTDFESHKPQGTSTSSSSTSDLSDLFSKLDSDSDGKIGETEFAKLLESMEQSRKQSFGTTYTNSASTSSGGGASSLLGVA